jgi:ATP-binding cassette subfamily B protein
MTYTTTAIQEFLAGLSPFNQLATVDLKRLSERFQLLRYRIGQEILVRDTMPAQVSILYEGQARLLGYDPQTQMPVTLRLLRPGEVLGWVGLVRGIPCETAIASTEVICLTLPAVEFLTLLSQEPLLAAAFQDRCALIEVFDLLGAELERRADSEAALKALGATNLKEMALKIWPEAVVLNLPPGKITLNQIDSNLMWLVSGGDLAHFPVGSRLPSNDAQTHLEVEGSGYARLVGFQKATLLPSAPTTATIGEASAPYLDGSAIAATATTSREAIPYAPERPPAPEPDIHQARGKYPYVRGRGPLEATLACFQMLSQYLGIPFRRDIVRRILVNQLEHHGSLSLSLCGAIAELMGLNTKLANVPAKAIGRLQAPTMIAWQDSFAILYKIDPKELVLAVPEVGLLRQKTEDFSEVWGNEGQVLLLQPTRDTPKQRFSLRWFLPSLYRYRKVLAEVLLASFFVQLLALANPLVTQVIFDKVLLQNSVNTLYALAIFLVIVAVFEAVLTSVRTHLFTDTTNRIDLALGSEVIDHLLRLPLRYFERRPVGELATRVNELENIRTFLTGTALTVVLDAVFSIIYIIVMVIYSWLLTLVALATVPLFALLTFVVSPVVRQQSRAKAERNAATHSYLVEILSGIQTVKAQNIELRSRWQWQERYAQYISAGFKTVSTSTTASSISNFLNKLSSLLVLCIGAFLVLQGQLTIGQLVAFRIISGYVTSPLLRLLQLWQNFQETALSLERLSDILDTPQEVDEAGRRNILMPTIQGAVKYENVSFRFASSGPPQLSNIHLDFSAGVFVGVVGMSGSGKSTLMKLLPRLYEPNSGRIFIDGYDISKVELYSVRRQIGMVLQDTLLFDGTVRENIALTSPEAADEEIVEAAKIAFAHDFIMALPSGYNTRVGERGSALSGGQRQRIAIARTVLQNPRLLILDEATSALDYQAERQVCLNLAEAFRDRTVFFITHRLSTIKNADVILMMDQGTVVEQDTHEQLMALRGSYYSLYQQQNAQL